MRSGKVRIRSDRTFRTSAACYKVAFILFHHEATILQLAACIGKGGLCHPTGVPPLFPGGALGAEVFECFECLALAVGQPVVVFEFNCAFATREYEAVL